MNINSLKNHIIVKIFSYSIHFHKFLRLVCKRWNRLFHSNDYLRFTSLTLTDFGWADQCDSITKIKLFKWLFIEQCPKYLEKNKQFCLSWFLNFESDLELISIAIGHQENDFSRDIALQNLFSVSLIDDRFLEFVVYAYDKMTTKLASDRYMRDVIRSASFKIMSDSRLPEINFFDFSHDQWDNLFCNSITFKSLDNFKNWVELFENLQKDTVDFNSKLDRFIYQKLLSDWRPNYDKMIYFFEKYPSFRINSQDFMLTLFDSSTSKVNVWSKTESDISAIDRFIDVVIKYSSFGSMTIDEIDLFWNNFIQKMNCKYKGSNFFKFVNKLEQKIGPPSQIIEPKTIIGCSDENVFIWMCDQNLTNNLTQNLDLSHFNINSHKVFILLQHRLGILYQTHKLDKILDHRIAFDLIKNHNVTFGCLGTQSYYDLELSYIFDRGLKYDDGRIVDFETFWYIFLNCENPFLSRDEKNDFFWWHCTRWLDFSHCENQTVFERVLTFANEMIGLSDEKMFTIVQLLLKWSKYLLVYNLYSKGIIRFEELTIKRLLSGELGSKKELKTFFSQVFFN